MILANLHGGFVALPVIVATAACGEAVSGPWDEARRRDMTKFGLAMDASRSWRPWRILIDSASTGTSVNYCFSSGVTSLIDEYQSAPFGKPKVRVLEMAVLAFVALPAVASRKVERYQLAHLLVWLHLALTSIRNALVLAGGGSCLACLLDSLPLSCRSNWVEPGRGRIWIPG